MVPLLLEGGGSFASEMAGGDGEAYSITLTFSLSIYLFQPFLVLPT
jgi:hypothetical protein